MTNLINCHRIQTLEEGAHLVYFHEMTQMVQQMTSYLKSLNAPYVALVPDIY